MTIDSYGKMRTCEYYPVALIDYDAQGHVIEPEYSLEADKEYLHYIAYNGTVNNQDVDHYTIIDKSTLDREDIYKAILESLE